MTPSLALWLLVPGPARAGMPMVLLTDVARDRLDALSFFAVLLLLSAAAVRGLWNRATALPRLSYPRALGLVVLWGLLFHLVLTMISGARELMTPGAWEKTGATYTLASDPAEAEELGARRARLEGLRLALWGYAQARGGELPPHEFAPEIPADSWLADPQAGLRYLYVPGRRVDEGHLPLAYEPGAAGAMRLVLFTDGAIEGMTLPALQEMQRMCRRGAETTPVAELRARIHADPIGYQLDQVHAVVFQAPDGVHVLSLPRDPKLREELGGVVCQPRGGASTYSAVSSYDLDAWLADPAAAYCADSPASCSRPARPGG